MLSRKLTKYRELFRCGCQPQNVCVTSRQVTIYGLDVTLGLGLGQEKCSYSLSLTKLLRLSQLVGPSPANQPNNREPRSTLNYVEGERVS